MRRHGLSLCESSGTAGIVRGPLVGRSGKLYERRGYRRRRVYRQRLTMRLNGRRKWLCCPRFVREQRPVGHHPIVQSWLCCRTVDTERTQLMRQERPIDHGYTLPQQEHTITGRHMIA